MVKKLLLYQIDIRGYYVVFRSCLGQKIMLIIVDM